MDIQCLGMLEANKETEANEAKENDGKFWYSGHHKTPEDKDIKFDIAVSVTVQNTAAQSQINRQRKFSRKRNDSGYEEENALPWNGMSFEEISENKIEENVETLKENQPTTAMGNIVEREPLLDNNNDKQNTQTDMAEYDAEITLETKNHSSAFRKKLFAGVILSIFILLIVCIVALWFTQLKLESVTKNYPDLERVPEIVPCLKECTNLSISNGWFDCENDTAWLEFHSGFKSSKYSLPCRDIKMENQKLKCRQDANPKKRNDIVRNSNVMLVAGGIDKSGNIVSDVSLYPFSPHLSQ